MRVIIDEGLAGALLTLIDQGKFDLFEFGQIRAVYDALRAAVDAAGVDVEVVPGVVAAAEVVDDFPGTQA